MMCAKVIERTMYILCLVLVFYVGKVLSKLVIWVCSSIALYFGRQLKDENVPVTLYPYLLMI